MCLLPLTGCVCAPLVLWRLRLKVSVHWWWLVWDACSGVVWCGLMCLSLGTWTRMAAGSVYIFAMNKRMPEGEDSGWVVKVSFVKGRRVNRSSGGTHDSECCFWSALQLSCATWRMRLRSPNFTFLLDLIFLLPPVTPPCRSLSTSPTLSPPASEKFSCSKPLSSPQPQDYRNFR